MTTIAWYNIGTSTTLESNKSLGYYRSTAFPTGGKESKQRCADAAVSGAVQPLGCTGYTTGEPRHRGFIMRRRREVLNDLGIRHTDPPTPHGAEETARDCLLLPDEAPPYGGSEEGMASRQGQQAGPRPATGGAAQSATTQAASPRVQGRVRGSIHATERRTGGRATVLVLWESAGGSPAAHCRTDGLHLR